jgi:glycerol-3-phosphate dehydrogenase subunit B
MGSLEENWLLPTAAGAIRPTCLAPETFAAGDLSETTPILLVGFEGFHDCYPHLAAENLSRQGIPANGVTVKLPGLATRQRIDAMVLAGYFENLDSLTELADAVQPHCAGYDRIGFPAVFGIKNAHRFVKALETKLQCRVFEIPGLPPSLPGMRLQHILVNAIQENGGQVFPGMEVVRSLEGETSDQIEAVLTEAAARPSMHTAQNFILATGGILGGGISTNHAGAVYDPIFNLSVEPPIKGSEWAQQDFLEPEGHPIFGVGSQPNEKFQTEFQNVFVIGGSLAGDFVRERSLEGVALISAYQVAEVLA